MASSKVIEGLSVLDNPAWNALNSHHAQFATGTNLAKRYQPQVSPYFAMVDHSEAALKDLSQISANDQRIRLFERHDPPELPGWTLNRTFTGHQMIYEGSVIELHSDVPIIDLTDADVPEMLHLIELSGPGPFLPRTIELGHYIGIRQQGQLVAMAGERFYLNGYHEISAVCTAPEHQGKGYARLLVSYQINEILKRGDVPFLHVLPDNAPAYRLYESLHFRKRAELRVTVLTR